MDRARMLAQAIMITLLACVLILVALYLFISTLTPAQIVGWIFSIILAVFFTVLVMLVVLKQTVSIRPVQTLHQPTMQQLPAYQPPRYAGMLNAPLVYHGGQPRRDVGVSTQIRNEDTGRHEEISVSLHKLRAIVMAYPNLSREALREEIPSHAELAHIINFAELHGKVRSRGKGATPEWIVSKDEAIDWYNSMLPQTRSD